MRLRTISRPLESAEHDNGGNKSKTTDINYLKVENNLLSDPQQIANELNEYFCNTSKTGGRGIPTILVIRSEH